MRSKLLGVHEELKKASLWHILAWSPLAWIFLLVMFLINVLKVRVSIKITRVPRDISTVLEQEALEQTSLAEDDEGCLVAV